MIASFHIAAPVTAGIVLVCALLLLSWVDLKAGILPDAVTLPLLWLGLLANLNGMFSPLQDAVLGAVLGYGLLWTANLVYRLASGMDGIGQGDFKLTAALGAWFGVGMVPWIILGACIAGWGAAIGRNASVTSAYGSPLRFGPCLSAAGAIALVVVFSR